MYSQFMMHGQKNIKSLRRESGHWNFPKDQFYLTHLYSKLLDCPACNCIRCCYRDACYWINARSLRLPTAV